MRTLRNSRRLLTSVGACSSGRRSALLVKAATLLNVRRLAAADISTSAPVLVSRNASLAMTRRARRKLEKRAYRHQLRLRLPCTVVKRRGLRQAGRTLFTRNTLAAPTTWLGARNRLLAPKAAWVLQGRGKQMQTSLLSSDMRYLEPLDSALPRAWRRPPSFMNTLRAFRQSEYRRIKARQQKYLAARRVVRGTLSTQNSNLRPFLARLGAAQRVIAGLAFRQNANKASLPLNALQTYTRRLTQQIRADALSSSGRRHGTAPTGATTQTTFKSARAGSPAEERITAATHVRSTRHMFAAERALSAWSPIYPLKWRR
jgi:hypothetical protein